MKPINRYLSLAVMALLSLGALTPLEAQETAGERTRVQPPAPLPLRPVSFPGFVERRLDNGAQIIVVEDQKTPVVTLSLRVRSGSSADPAGKIGVADFTASLLNKGTSSRSAREIAESIDFVGGSLGAGASSDWTNVSATVLTEYLDTALVLLSDIVLNPTFPESEFELHRQQTLSALQVAQGQPDAIASRVFMKEIYGEHPYGATQSPESVGSLSREDLIAFHEAHYRPGNTLIVVAGDVRADDIVDRLNRAFGGWEAGDAPRAQQPTPPSRSAREITLVHKPGSVQAVIRIGHLLPDATHRDWVTLDVANQVLGGGTTGWLFRVLRAEKGYTYGAYASAAQRPGPGYFLATAEVRNEVVDSAMGDFFRLIDQLRDQPVPADDMRMARDHMVGSFPLTIETPQQIAGQVARTRLLGLPADHIERYRDRVAAVEVDALQRVARELIRPDLAAVVVVGDAGAILDMVEPFGPVQVVDVDGAPITRTELEGGASGFDLSTLDPSSIEPQSLEYQVIVQGNPIGQSVATITREVVDGKDAVVVRSKDTGMLNGESELAFGGGEFIPLYARSSQVAGPQTITSELEVRDGRIVGQATGPDGGVVDVDAEAVDGVLLSGMEQYALGLVDFAKEREVSLQVFNAGTGGVVSAAFRVVGESTISVPAGEFEVYEIEASGGPIPLKLYLRKAAPHLVVRQEVIGQPITIELTSFE